MANADMPGVPVGLEKYRNKVRAAIKLAPRKETVLRFLGEYYEINSCCLYFQHISDHALIDKKEVRRICRYLARVGLAEYCKGLFNEDGGVGGAGYCCTRAGKEWLEAYGIDAEISDTQQDRSA